MITNTKIPLAFHDIVNVLMWDDSYNKENVISRIPCGTKVAYWLARAFTLSNMKKYANKGQFTLSYYYQKNLPLVEGDLKSLLDFYLSQIKQLKSLNRDNTISSLIDVSAFMQTTEMHISVLPCPPVLMFIRVNLLCDEAHTELRKLYQFGSITKSDYFKQRRELFKPLNKFRADFATKVSEAGRLLRTFEAKLAASVKNDA
ncbi:hypothetical protein ACOMYX_19655 (plasmid) [Pantoea agglomerans]|uniref:hypothetical protein n=1 Tax=Enterobacter agglomerans TaxID=549 RepID=UPI003B93EDD3